MATSCCRAPIPALTTVINLSVSLFFNDYERHSHLRATTVMHHLPLCNPRLQPRAHRRSTKLPPSLSSCCDLTFSLRYHPNQQPSLCDPAPSNHSTDKSFGTRFDFLESKFWTLKSFLTKLTIYFSVQIYLSYCFLFYFSICVGKLKKSNHTRSANKRNEFVGKDLKLDEDGQSCGVVVCLRWIFRLKKIGKEGLDMLPI